jgi:hypothetical protein
MLKSLVGMIEIVEANGLCLKAGTRYPGLELLRPVEFPVLQIGRNLHRELTCALRQYPSSTFRGTGSFHLCEPTTEEYSAEMLYFENGGIIILQGFVMRGRRKDVYRPT